MINESYVSFETANLLKEKGFDVSCYGRYSVRSKEFHLDTTKPCNNGGISQYSAPTQQMAMAWLREIHSLSVEVYRTACGYIGCIVNIPFGTDLKFLEETGDDLASGQYTTWEGACEAAIQYCLEKLI